MQHFVTKKKEEQTLLGHQQYFILIHIGSKQIPTMPQFVFLMVHTNDIL